MNAEIHTPADEHEREIWAFLQQHRDVTYDDVRQNCSASINKAERYLRRLRRLGIMRIARREGAKIFYTVHSLEDQMAMAAERRAGKEAAIWQAMRVLRDFSVQDLSAALMAVDGITTREIRKYCLLLTRIKYLAVIHRDKQTRMAARFRVTRDTGPLPPVQKRMFVVIDGNEDRIVFAGGELL